MLQNTFFTIDALENTALNVQADLTIDAHHAIFSGHFPGQPVVPGVCMMQMVKELLEQALGYKTNVLKAQEMKFLALIDPIKNNEVSALLKYDLQEDGTVHVVASIFKEQLVHFKFKGQFRDAKVLATTQV